MAQHGEKLCRRAGDETCQQTKQVKELGSDQERGTLKLGAGGVAENLGQAKFF